MASPCPSPTGAEFAVTIDAGNGGHPQQRHALTLDAHNGDTVSWIQFADLSASRQARNQLLELPG